MRSLNEGSMMDLSGPIISSEEVITIDRNVKIGAIGGLE